jgi:hypothetical protein
MLPILGGSPGAAVDINDEDVRERSGLKFMSKMLTKGGNNAK